MTREDEPEAYGSRVSVNANSLACGERPDEPMPDISSPVTATSPRNRLLQSRRAGAQRAG